MNKGQIEQFYIELEELQKKHGVYLSPEVVECWDCDESEHKMIDITPFTSLRAAKTNFEIARIIEDGLQIKGGL